jgi:cation:H+ antiporter
MTFVLLAVSFALILGGALLFTNAVEWAGQKLNLGESAVGSLLAAVGTALPESMIPIVALIGGSGGAEAVAIGSIIGAPFLLATLAMVLIGVSALAYHSRRESGKRVEPDVRGMRRDLLFFVVLFAVGIGVGLGVPPWARYVLAALLVVAYVVYTLRTIRKGGGAEDEELSPLYFHRSAEDPAAWRVAAQNVIGLALIIGGAELFVEEVTVIAEKLGVGPLVLSLLLAPLATELPEKANSVLWVRRDKDSLALGNVTGAMVFQSAVPVAVGLVFTEWALEASALLAGLAGVLGGLVALVALWRRSFGVPYILAWSGLLVAWLAFITVGPSSEPAPPPGAPPPAGAVPPPPGGGPAPLPAPPPP